MTTKIDAGAIRDLPQLRRTNDVVLVYWERGHRVATGPQRRHRCSRKSYFYIGLPSGSLAMNRVEAAKDVTKLTKLWIGVTPVRVGRVDGAPRPELDAVAGATHIVSAPAPARYVTCESWEASTKFSRPGGATPSSSQVLPCRNPRNRIGRCYPYPGRPP